jgi:nucleoside-diphosphate-sugar epimerase
VNRVLVTGGTGFIGRQTVEPLVRRGYEVHCVSSRAVLDADSSVRGMHFHRADLHDESAVRGLMSELTPSHLLHLAWYAEHGRFWTSPENLRWVESSLRLLRSFAETGGRRVVVAGSCAEYAWGERTVCREDETPLAPATLYGASKHALHLIAEPYCELTGVSLAWGRVFFVFGQGESTRRLGGSVASALVRGDPARCTHSEQVRDFLHCTDLGDAFAALLDSEVRGAVNLASGHPIRLRDLVTALGDAAGRPELVEFGALPASPGEPVELCADVSRLGRELGWAPSATLEERARETIAWWRTQPEGTEPPPAPSARVARS